MQQKVELVLKETLPHDAFPKPILQLVLKYMFYGESSDCSMVHSRFGNKVKRNSTFTMGDKIEFTCPYLDQHTLFILIEEQYLAVLYSQTHIVVYNYALQKIQCVAEGKGFFDIKHDPKENVLVVERQHSLETYRIKEDDLERQLLMRLQFSKMVVWKGLVFCFQNDVVTIYETKELSLKSQFIFAKPYWDAVFWNGKVVVSFTDQPDLECEETEEKEYLWKPRKEKLDKTFWGGVGVWI